MTRRWKLVLSGAAAAVVVSSLFWGPRVMRRMDFFRLRRVEFAGARYIPPAELLAKLHVDTTMSIWDPTDPLAERVKTHPQVLGARITRKLPGTLVVEIEERVPIALVAGREGLRAYDDKGVRLPIDPARVPVDAPILTVADTSLLALLGRIRTGLPDVYARLNTLSREGRDELLLRLDSVPVRAMSDVTVERLEEIAPVEADLGRRGARVTELDLRYRNQVIARVQ